jgi:hypothetical protein
VEDAAGRIPSILEIVSSDLFPWVVIGAGVGFVLNARDQGYVGISAVFERYGVTRVPFLVWLLLDIAFFIGVGPLVVTAAYAPAGLFQAITLGLGWPLVIRGATANINRREG